MEKTEKTISHRRAARMQQIRILVVFVLVVATGVFGFLKYYGIYINQTLYAERLSQMSEVTSQLFSGLEDVVENLWTFAKTQKSYLQAENPGTEEELHAFMERQADINAMADTRTEVMAVDREGRYYTQNGMQGTLEGMGYLQDSPEQVSYVYNTMTYNRTEMVFLLKMETPVTIEVEGKETELIYYGVSRDMEELSPYFRCSAYGGNNSVYVLDPNGAKLFSDTEGQELLKGYNLYAVLRKMSYLHDSSFEKATQELQKNKIAYSNAMLDGAEYYYALYQMNHAQWTLLFLVPSAYVAVNTVSLINITVESVLIFAILLVAVSGFTIYLMLRSKQKQVIDAERKNSEMLEEINARLDRKNIALSQAVLDAEQAREQAEAAMHEAETANKAKSDFLANMSHDIRTPMNAIVGIISLMEHEQETSDRLQTYVKKVQSSSRHLLSLINDILDMSKIESGEVALTQEPVSLAEQVGQIDSVIRSQTNEHGQTFEIRVHHIEHEYLIGDAMRLRQVFLNLLSNAIKYTPQGGVIRMDLEELPCKATGYASFQIRVRDTGCGMDAEFIKHIFEPFTRAENSVTNKVQGTGLGMAITKNIVDMMNGEITVESTPGEGSCFYVTVDMRIDDSIEHKMENQSVLMISKDRVLNENVQASLKETGAEYHVTSTVEEALGYLKKNQADIILMSGYLQDEKLPDEVEKLRQVSKEEGYIFCCDYAIQEDVHEILNRSKVSGLIARPFFLFNLIHGLTQAEKGIRAEEGTSVLNGMKFLCAEDNELNAEILESMLDMYGASCTLYPDGEALTEAFEQVKPGDYDAILMDIQMPRMNGLEASQAIRSGKNPLGREIPIIAMTANAFSEDVQHCLSAGMDAHIAKPIDMTVLEQTVKKVLGGGRTRRR